jgi:cell division protease FtsH
VGLAVGTYKPPGANKPTFSPPTTLVEQGYTVEERDGKQIARKDGVELVDTVPDNTTEKVVLSNVDAVLVKAKMGKIKRATLSTAGYPMYAFELNNKEGSVMLLPKPTDDKENQRLIEGLAASGITTAGPQDPNVGMELLARLASTLLYVGLIAFVLMYVLQKAQGAGFMTDMKGKKVSEIPDVSLDDVQGIDEVKEEIQDIIDYLKNPLDNPTGAKMPRGVLLVGPPGNGKTHLARAVAAEAKVPFYSTNGSEFVEMFVGRGAGRVRSLFEEAAKNTPCVIFIDEIDTVGQKRGRGVGNSHGEQEQTLNQLLAQLDGFSKTPGIVVIAATNRPDTMDEALMSRFSKQIPVMRPQTSAQRLAILSVHAKNKPLGATVNLNELAEMTSGFSGRNLADLMEEAARLANRRIKKAEREAAKKLNQPTDSPKATDSLVEHAKHLFQKADLRSAAGLTPEDLKIQQADLVQAWQNTLIGPGKPMENYPPEFLERVKIHEGWGHAWLCHLLNVGTHIVSAQPRGETGGIVAIDQSAFSPMMPTKQDMLKQILITLGGKAAEEMFYGEPGVSTGAANDLEKATDQIKAMIGQLGLFPKEFGILVERGQNGYGTSGSSFSPEQQRELEQLAHTILDNAYAKVKAVIEPVPPSARQALLDKLTASPVVSGKAQTQQLFTDTAQSVDVAALKALLEGFLKQPVPTPQTAPSPASA